MEHVFIYEKGKVTVTGVKSLDGFEETEVKIRLESNTLTLKGGDFVLLEMAQSAGKVCFSGKLSSMQYAVKGEKVPFVKRLLK